MNVLIASDSFKGSFSSSEVGRLIESGIKRVYPDLVSRIISVADGGEGTVKSVVSAVGGEYVTIEATGPLGSTGTPRSIAPLGSAGSHAGTGLPGSAGIPGNAGSYAGAGLPGSADKSASAGLPGTPGDTGSHASAGLPGTPGDTGSHASAGLPGSADKSASAGLPGTPGDTGSHASAGLPGTPGDTGSHASAGLPGSAGTRVMCTYGILRDNTAIIEMAESSGLNLVPDGMRNPLITTTYGLGEQIKDAVMRGCRKIYIGIGGSATNDLGIGMAKALGFIFLDKDGNEVDGTGGDAGKIVTVSADNVMPELRDIEIVAMCDVTNPLCGRNGASYVYGPQKGATPEMIEILDANLFSASDVINSCLGKNVRDIPGAGAAGGLGAGIMAFCNGRLEKGIDIILDLIDIDNIIEQADIVITGEGRIDAQTLNGKVPAGISARCRKKGKPCYAVCGFLGEGWEQVLESCLDGAESAVFSPCTIDEAIAASKVNIPFAAERLFRIIKSVLK